MNNARKFISLTEQFGTPLYVYDMPLLRRTLADAVAAASVNARFRLHYAMKACYEPRVLAAVEQYIDGIDAVSGGEIELAVEAGFSPERIMLAGVGKTDREIDMALSLGIEALNVESIPELEVISERAVMAGKTASVCLRINPDIDAHTHKFITTGLDENKFGIGMRRLDDAVALAHRLPNIVFDGLHFHIGSQITVSEPFKVLCERVNRMVADLRGKGYSVRTVNMGGGLGIDYNNPSANPIPDFKEYFDTFHSCLDTNHVDEVRFELGRALVAQCGNLMARVLYVKRTDTRTFVIIDAGMTDLVRPALYGARHNIINISGMLRGDSDINADIVGPVCESSDVFATDCRIAEPRRGDILCIQSAGAYGATMASRYNARPIAPAAFIE